MKSITTALLILLCLSRCTPVMAEEFVPPKDFMINPSSVNRVYDGDTIFVNLPFVPALFGEDIGVRARGYDTPEIRSYCDTEALKEKERQYAYKARDRVTELIEGSTYVLLREPERGKYFRIVATILVDGKSIGDILEEEGLAVPYSGGTRPDWCILLSD